MKQYTYPRFNQIFPFGSLLLNIYKYGRRNIFKAGVNALIPLAVNGEYSFFSATSRLYFRFEFSTFASRSLSRNMYK